MPEALKRHVGNDWLPTEATITACEQTSQETFTDEGYTPPEYRVSFSYVVDGRVLEGSYRATFRRSADTASRFFTTPKNQAGTPGRTRWSILGSSGEQESSSELGWRCWLAGFGAIKTGSVIECPHFVEFQFGP
jgi:hypothetical protein